MSSHYVGQRLSLKGQTLTIRYVGEVKGKPGEWLGGEWDDPKRGKHNGSHEGRQYFTCKSQATTCASFLRPDQTWDEPRSFYQALREKYIDANERHDSAIVYVSGKQAEEVGFDKFAQRQRELRGIRTIVLDRMRIRHRPTDPDVMQIEETCSEITNLHIGGNLFETVAELYDLCRRLPKLKLLNLDGNRFETESFGKTFPSIKELSLSNTFLQPASVAKLLFHFPIVHSVACARNEWDHIPPTELPKSLRSLDVSENQFDRISACSCLTTSELTSINLKRNKISTVGSLPSCRQEEIDLSFNSIGNLVFFDDLYATFPHLKHLRTAVNVVYTNQKTPHGKPLTPEEGSMLTIARIPTLQTLNYSTITPKDRLNAETYYLSQIALSLSLAPPTQHEAILSQHARWKSLYEEYGEPTIQAPAVTDAKGYPAHSLASRLAALTFHTSSHETSASTWMQEVPKAFSIYRLLGLVGKRLGIMPLRLRLIWETGEKDPRGVEIGDGMMSGAAEWWDSEDESDGEGKVGEEMMVAREVELVAGTRPLGTYIDGKEAMIRVEVREGIGR